MKELNAVSYILIDDVDIVKTFIKEMGYQIFNIDGTKITTIEEFFIWVKNELPQDPPLSGKVNFDAFVDSLWGGIDSFGEEKIAIIWTNPTKIMNLDKGKFKTLIACLEELSRTLTLEEYGVEKPILLKTILLGEGEEFLKFEKAV